MKRLMIILGILCGCSAEPERMAPVEFLGTKAGDSADADMTSFHYLAYDYSLGSWVGELGGVAVKDDTNPGRFLPSDASRVYWPEGKTYSFYAVGYNSKQPVDENDVEFGSAMMIYSSGTNAVLMLKNTAHNVDWLAAKNIRQGKIDGIPLVFKHISARIGKLTFDFSAYWEWLTSRELDIADIKVVSCTLTDAEEQTYIFSSVAETMFNREAWDYRSSPARPLADNIPFFAFPGTHKLELRVQTVDRFGIQRIDDRAFSCDVALPMGADCELVIRVNPDDRDLEVNVVQTIAGWTDAEEGVVNE